MPSETFSSWLYVLNVYHHAPPHNRFGGRWLRSGSACLEGLWANKKAWQRPTLPLSRSSTIGTAESPTCKRTPEVDPPMIRRNSIGVNCNETLGAYLTTAIDPTAYYVAFRSPVCGAFTSDKKWSKALRSRSVDLSSLWIRDEAHRGHHGSFRSTEDPAPLRQNRQASARPRSQLPELRLCRISSVTPGGTMPSRPENIPI
jgi:hypothetical protein